GRLVGNWFRVGSGGYAGLNLMNEGYWDGHLAVVYDGNDPGQIDISFGNYRGAPGQFAVIGDLPDPATVSQSTGLIRYELGLIQTYSASTGTIGTVLMQMIATRGIKVE